MTLRKSGSSTSLTKLSSPTKFTPNGVRMSARRMSVKLIPRLASTGPSVKARNSRANGICQHPGRDRLLAARRVDVLGGPEWGRRCPRTAGIARGPGGDLSPLVGGSAHGSRTSEPGADRLGSSFCMPETASSTEVSPLVAFSVSLSMAAESWSQVGTAGGARASSSCWPNTCSCGSSASQAGVPRRLHGRQVAHLVVEALLRLGLAEPLDVLPGGVLVVRVAEHRQVAATGERRAGRAVLAGQRHDGVLVGLHAGVLHQARVPRTGDERAVGAVGAKPLSSSPASSTAVLERPSVK